MADHDPTSPVPTTTRVALVLDLDAHPNIAFTLGLSRLHEAIAKLRRHGHNATAIRVDINGEDYLKP